MEKDYYDILGVPRNASAEDIKRTYHILAHQFHPDRPDGSERRFKAVNEAYRILSDSKGRARYDREFANDQSDHLKEAENLEESSRVGSGVARGILLILLIGLVSVGIYFAFTSSNTPQSSSNQAVSSVVAPQVPSSPSQKNSQPTSQQSPGTPSNTSVGLTPSLINEIEPSIVEVNCYSADDSIVSSGSGVSAHQPGVGDYIETNYHVVGDAVINGQAPNCYAVYPEAPDFLYNESHGDYELILNTWHYNPNIYQDVAMLTVGVPLPNTTPLNQIPVINNFYNSVKAEMHIANTASSFCSPSEVDVGDILTVFGYPKSGNLLGISETITKGSIAGILPGPIYKTDAPIDHGNSGGFAILDKDLCSLGIPTLGESGLTAGIGYIQAYTLANSGQ